MKVFMDSGAFSALTKKKEIDIKKYISFLFKNKKYISHYVNLDIIDDPKGTWQNQKIMEKAGLNPLPVFHLGDDIKYLYKCMDYEYFCLGGVAGTPTKKVRIPFFNKCFDLICGKNGIPQNKIHGLGVTSLNMLRKYPFYSVDSTSWLMTSAMGSIFVPPKINGKYIYQKDPYKLNISIENPNKKHLQHYETLSSFEKKIVEEYIIKKGYVLEKVQKNYKTRANLNIQYFLDFQNFLPVWPWPFKKQKRSNILI